MRSLLYVYTFVFYVCRRNSGWEALRPRLYTSSATWQYRNHAIILSPLKPT